jgi:hypothetical protein
VDETEFTGYGTSEKKIQKEVPEQEVNRLIKQLKRTLIRIWPDESGGILDGTSYRLELGSWQSKASFEWGDFLPTQWKALEEVFGFFKVN